ncbi:protein NRT1/ PTR FAMILY 5.5-like [Impatiens glandulifera]|uniref:protein NRT1/ PTR FAMILY 5.5-like n=1 Tax=Impatiens glandulifera TaxID=253017 RepID=UPI001FB0A7D7|nr:protein NRT1/ PTR FAMILY 5.5-like [Impatiens glandulifera]
MAYLTTVWNLKFTYAAAIVNLFKGSIQLMPMAMQFLVDSYTGHFFMLLFTSISYCIGLGLLTISTPPVTGICGEYEAKCIGEEGRELFFAALAFIAVGMSGFNVSAHKFQYFQVVAEMVKGTSYDFGFMYRSCYVVTSTIPIVLILVISFVKQWLIHFGLPVVFTLIATVLFASGSCEYEVRDLSEKGSPLTAIFRVFVASIFKRYEEYPANPNELYKGNSDSNERLRHTPLLRFLDKAAIILPTSSLVDQEREKWRLCSVTEVEETKRMICIIPICLSIIVFGVVSALGDTYFQEQATTMNAKIWRLTVPLNFFKLIYNGWQGPRGPTDQDKFPGLFGVGFVRLLVAMVIGIVCCSTAAIVEFCRLKANKYPMSILWLIPQFILLGIFERKYEQGSYNLLAQTIGPAMKEDYLGHVVSIFSGIGIIGGTVGVLVVDLISKSGGKGGWFQDSLNESRLDYYYWLLALLGVLNVGFFLFMNRACNSWLAQLEEIRNERDEDVSAIEASYDRSDLIRPFLE